VLVTLPAREFRSGLYEVVKYGVIASRPLFDRVSRRLSAVLTQTPRETAQIVAACCRIKAEVVSRDEREQGERRVLNFGHTVGHALEAMTGFRRFRHGEAIAHGMLAAARVSRARGLMSDDEVNELDDVIRRLGPLPPVADLSVAEALVAIRSDKKVIRGRLHFVLADGIGATAIVDDVGEAELRAAMRAIGLRR
jgi:3-dehydroquinate synthase